MAGHSHWKQIKEKKGAEDKKRSQTFSKLLNAISIAARAERNPDWNPRLRTAVDKAKKMNVPQENIERAVRRGEFKGDALEEFFAGAYGPGNAAILIEVVSDNKNHAIGDIKRVLKEYGAKWAESQSVEWAFEKRQENDGEHRWLWKPKFSQELKNDERERLERLKEELQELPEVYAVHTNTN